MLSRGNRLDGRRVASLTLLASEKGGEGGGGRPRGGTGMPAEWERYATSLRISSSALVCMRM